MANSAASDIPEVRLTLTQDFLTITLEGVGPLVRPMNSAVDCVP